MKMQEFALEMPINYKLSAFVILAAGILCFLATTQWKSAEVQLKALSKKPDIYYNNVRLIRSEDSLSTYHALNHPKFLKAREMGRQLYPESLVIGVVISNESKAYPLQILNWHEIVNDTAGGQLVTVTYCPLTHSSVVFLPEFNGISMTFTNSEFVYESNLVMKDGLRNSFWQQLSGTCIFGPFTGAKLPRIPCYTTTWKEWSLAHPDTLVVSFETGFTNHYALDYRSFPWGGSRNPAPIPIFQMSRFDGRLDVNDLVFGIDYNGEAKAFLLAQIGTLPCYDQCGGARVRISEATGTLRFEVQPPGSPRWTEMVATPSFWFGWQAAFPNTLIYEAGLETPNILN